MNAVVANWEDEENNRQVQYLVAYAIENGQVEIQSVTPKKVTFVCQETGSIKGSVGVHTAKGKRMLASKIPASQLEAIANEIAERNSELAVA